MSELRASIRDASWLRSPSIYGRVVYHVHAGDELENMGAHAACNSLWWLPPLKSFVSVRASAVPLELRCQRPGCRKLWPVLT